MQELSRQIRSDPRRALCSINIDGPRLLKKTHHRRKFLLIQISGKAAERIHRTGGHKPRNCFYTASGARMLIFPPSGIQLLQVPARCLHPHSSQKILPALISAGLQPAQTIRQRRIQDFSSIFVPFSLLCRSNALKNRVCPDIPLFTKNFLYTKFTVSGSLLSASPAFSGRIPPQTALQCRTHIDPSGVPLPSAYTAFHFGSLSSVRPKPSFSEPPSGAEFQPPIPHLPRSPSSAHPHFCRKYPVPSPSHEMRL